jgi:predicted peroxiredoxin
MCGTTNKLVQQTQKQKRRNAMKKFMVLMVAVFFASIPSSGVAGNLAAEPVRDGVFLHISHGKDNPHRLLMALNMAKIMADDHDVLVYFDIKAVNAVLKDSEDIVFAHFPSSKASLAALKAKDVILMACPGCLKVAGKPRKTWLKAFRSLIKRSFFHSQKGGY